MPMKTPHTVKRAEVNLVEFYATMTLRFLNGGTRVYQDIGRAGYDIYVNVNTIQRLEIDS